MDILTKRVGFMVGYEMPEGEDYTVIDGIVQRGRYGYEYMLAEGIEQGVGVQVLDGGYFTKEGKSKKIKIGDLKLVGSKLADGRQINTAKIPGTRENAMHRVIYVKEDDLDRLYYVRHVLTLREDGRGYEVKLTEYRELNRGTDININNKLREELTEHVMRGMVKEMSWLVSESMREVNTGVK